MNQDKNGNSNSQNQPKKGNSNVPPQVSPQLIEKFLDQQKQQVELQREELVFKKQELEVNAKLAEKQMDLQAEFLRRKPVESRKTMQLFIISVSFIIVVFLAFLTLLVYTGHGEVAKKIIEHFIVAGSVGVGSYYAGQKKESKRKKKESDIEDAEVVDD